MRARTYLASPFDVRARFEHRHLLLPGQGPGPLDNLIAATALRHNATLVTHKVEELGRVRGLEIRDWFE